MEFEGKNQITNLFDMLYWCKKNEKKWQTSTYFNETLGNAKWFCMQGLIHKWVETLYGQTFTFSELMIIKISTTQI